MTAPTDREKRLEAAAREIVKKIIPPMYDMGRMQQRAVDSALPILRRLADAIDLDARREEASWNADFAANHTCDEHCECSDLIAAAIRARHPEDSEGER